MWKLKKNEFRKSLLNKVRVWCNRQKMFNLTEPSSMTEQKFEQRPRFMVSADYSVGKVAGDSSLIDCQSGMSGKCLPVKPICHLYTGNMHAFLNGTCTPRIEYKSPSCLWLPIELIRAMNAKTRWIPNS